MTQLMRMFISQRNQYITTSLLKNVKLIGFPNHSIKLLVHYFEGAKGNTYFMWQEDPNNSSHLSNPQNVITVIQNALPKYFSWVLKRFVGTYEFIMLVSLNIIKFGRLLLQKLRKWLQ